MFLKELEITKRLKQPQSLPEVLQAYGWHVLGTGKDATVAEHPNKTYVLKIWARGSLYERFVPFVQQHADNPHVPKFSRYIKSVPGTRYLYVRMEKLNSLTNTHLLSTYLREIIYLWLAGKKVGLKGNLEWMLEYRIEEYLLSLGITSAEKDFLKPDVEAKLWKDIGMPPGTWINVVDALMAYTTNIGITSLDIHEENLMQRDDTLVITDPYYQG
jgi:hypothetical protein